MLKRFGVFALLILMVVSVGCQRQIAQPRYASVEEALSLEIDLTRAAADHDIDRVRELLNEGADPDGLMGTKARRYQYANRNRDALPYVAGVSPSPLLACLAPTPYEDRPEPGRNHELWPVQRRQAEIAQLLLSAGAEPNLQADRQFGLFPLLLAAQDGNWFAVRVLLEAGANPRLSTEGFTQIDPSRSPSNALGQAVSNQDIVMVEMLLDAEAYALDGGYVFNPLERAARTGNATLLLLLLESLGYADDDDFLELEPSGPYYAPELSRALTQLIDAWPEADDDSVTDIERPGYRDCFDLLLDAGATLEAGDIGGLIYDIERAGDPELTAWFEQALLRHATANPVAVMYMQALVDRGRLDALAEFIEQGVNINATDARGQTMLHYVVMHGSASAYIALMNAGIDPEIRDHDGKAALDYADDFFLEDLELSLEQLQRQNNAE